MTGQVVGSIAEFGKTSIFENFSGIKTLINASNVNSEVEYEVFA